MSLAKLLKAPLKLFKKDVITFLIVRRYDLGCLDDKLRYIAIRPSASLSVLRQKVWHLLDLPDFCDEHIVLKTDTNTEIPLTELRNGNDPQRPYILEVWLPDKRIRFVVELEVSGSTLNQLIPCSFEHLSARKYSRQRELLMPPFFRRMALFDKHSRSPSIASTIPKTLQETRKSLCDSVT